MWSRNLSALVAAAFFPLGASADVAADARKCFDAVEASSYEQALALCDAALDAKKLEGDNLAITLNNRGRAFLHLDDAERARADFVSAVEAAPDYAHPYNNLGIALAKLGRHDKAIESYSTAIALDDGYVHAFYNRGLSHRDLGELDAAVGDFDAAAMREPGLVAARLQRGLTRAAMGQCGDALGDLGVVAADEAGLETLRAQTQCHRQLGDVDARLASLTAIIERFPSERDALVERGELLASRGDASGAFADFDAAIAEGAGDARVFIGRAKTRPGEHVEEVVADLNRAIEIDSNWAEAYTLRASALEEKGDLEAALADLETGLDLDPANIDTRDRIASVSLKIDTRNMATGDAEREEREERRRPEAGAHHPPISFQMLDLDAQMSQLPAMEDEDVDAQRATDRDVTALVEAPELEPAKATDFVMLTGDTKARRSLEEHEAALKKELGLVRVYQRTLSEAGYDPGPVDGLYGPKTREALRLCLDAQRGCPLD